MSKRDDGVPRRLRWASLLAAGLVLGTGTAAAQAYWKAQTTLSGAVTAGAFGLTTAWGTDWQKWTPPLPGRSADTATLTVTETGASGTTLRWRLTPMVTLTGVTAQEAAHVTTQVFVGNCGSATTIAPGTSYAPPGGFSPGQSVALCLRVTLATSAPTALRNRELLPKVDVTADQVVS